MGEGWGKDRRLKGGMRRRDRWMKDREGGMEGMKGWGWGQRWKADGRDEKEG